MASGVGVGGEMGQPSLENRLGLLRESDKAASHYTPFRECQSSEGNVQERHREIHNAIENEETS